jgi:predicted nucleotidyltransferase
MEGSGRTVKTLAEIHRVLQRRRQILHEAYRVRSIGIFGSRARGDDTLLSDVDILVELEGPVGWEIVDLHRYLEDTLGVKVDLVTEGAVRRKPLLWESIQEDLTYVEA